MAMSVSADTRSAEPKGKPCAPHTQTGNLGMFLVTGPRRSLSLKLSDTNVYAGYVNRLSTRLRQKEGGASIGDERETVH